MEEMDAGKTTALNVIAAKLGAERDTPYNRSEFFEDYLELCDAEVIGKLPKGSRIITSDDVFDYMLNIRSLNNGGKCGGRNCLKNTWK